MLYLFDAFEFDDRGSSLCCDGKPMRARPMVIELLRQLLRKRGRVVPREELIESLWPGIQVGQTSLSTLLNETRGLLRDSGIEQKFIRTVAGRGYRFVGKVEVRPSQGVDGDGRGWFDGTGIHDRFDQLLERLPRHNASPLLIQGEPGSGKSRLAENLLQMAAERGIVCLKIHCSRSGMNTDWAPWLKTLPWRDGKTAGGAVPCTPPNPSETEWNSEPSLVHGPFRPGRDTSDEIVTSVCDGLFRCVAQQGPTLLLLEDLHWSDPFSLLVLERLIGWPAPDGLLVVSTTRPASWAAEPLGRSRLRKIQDAHGSGRCLKVPPLTTRAIHRILARRAGPPSRPREAHWLRHWTGGNPRLLGRLLDEEDGNRHHWTGPEPSPALSRSLEEIIQGWLEPLGHSGLELLRVAAGLGSGFDQRLWLHAAGGDPERTVQSFSDVLETGLIGRIPGPYPRYRFRHDLVRIGVLQSLSESERSRLQARATDAMEARGQRNALDPSLEFTSLWHPEGTFKGIRPELERTLRAGHSASLKGELDSATHWLRRALEIIGSAPDRLVKQNRTPVKPPTGGSSSVDSAMESHPPRKASPSQAVGR